MRQFIRLFLVVIIIVISLFCSSCSSEKMPNSTHSEPIEAALPSTEAIASERHLKITVQSSKFSKTFMPEELNNKLSYPLFYNGLKEVTIEINGKNKLLENAIRYGNISFDDICYLAKLDAKNGECTETYVSSNGLTKFLYSYPEFDLKIVNDVYETPDGQQHLIQDIALYSPGGETPRIYTDPQTYAILDREDWGITFEVVEATSTSIKIQYSQSGGQQIGELVPDLYYIIDDAYSLQLLPGVEPVYDYCIKLPETALTSNGSGTIEIDWTNIYGPLESGNYTLSMQLKDIYEDNAVHPLMKNYWDEQNYTIEFTVN